MAAGGIKVLRVDEEGKETGEILNRDELDAVRLVIEPGNLSALKLLLGDAKDLHEIAEGKKASIWVWKQVGALAKWVGIVVGALVAWKAYVASGGSRP